MFDIVETIQNWWTSFLENVLWRLFYYIEIVICKLIGIAESIMMVFTGEDVVQYKVGQDVQEKTLIEVFFTHPNVRSIYGAMGLIGIVFAFCFALVQIVRKVLDLRDKMQGITIGQILGNLLKSILLIASMQLIMLVAINVTDTLITSIRIAVTNSEQTAQGKSDITFTDEQYAAMGRIFNTLGNYSLNPSYRTRYNLNACYNDIRGDLEFLGNQGVFQFHYISYKNDDQEAGVVEPTWQSLIERIGKAYDYTQETTLDSYNDGLMNAMLDVMETMKANPNIRVLKTYHRELEVNTEAIPMDRVLFLVGTMGTFTGDAAARVKQYNDEPTFYDAVRQPFYYGFDGSDIYDYDEVRAVFDPSPSKTNYVLVYAAAISILQEMLVIVITCSVRIFSLLTLYLVSPLVIAAIPLDDGAKLKQWTTAFLVQLLGVVGMVLAMRVFLMFLPIIWSPSLVVSDNMILSTIIKIVITNGAITAVSRINGVLTGILADSAGWQAISAGDMRGEAANSGAGKFLSGASASKLAGSAWEKTGGKLAGAAYDQTVGKAKNAVYNATIGKAYSAITGKDINTGEKTAAQQAKDSRDHKREIKDMKQNLAHAKKTGKTLDGKKTTANDRKQMEHAIGHMEGGMSKKDAMDAAKQDMKADRKDKEQNASNNAKRLKNPPPGRGEGSGEINDNDYAAAFDLPTKEDAQNYQ